MQFCTLDGVRPAMMRLAGACEACRNDLLVSISCLVWKAAYESLCSGEANTPEVNTCDQDSLSLY